MKDFWHAPKMWKDQTVFIIGGGPSLKGFDWSRLVGHRCIGCNDAYKLGAEVSDVCYFGDHGWFKAYWERNDLRTYKGLIIGCPSKNKLLGVYYDDKPVLLLKRDNGQLKEAPDVGWFQSTGASAINLAIIFGACRVVLLGFDMHQGAEKENNWHPSMRSKPLPCVYNKFLRWFGMLKQQLDTRYPDVEVINATPGSSLTLFPICSPDDVL